MKKACRDIKTIIWMKWRLRCKRCYRKVRKTPQPKKSLEFTDSSEEEQKPKKASGPSDGKKAATKAEKNN